MVIKRASRKRLLDYIKVRESAARQGIKNQQMFEHRYFAFLERGHDKYASLKDSKMPSNAWNGIAIDVKHAQRIAEFLCIPGGYGELLGDSGSSWEKLMEKAGTTDRFIEMGHRPRTDTSRLFGIASLDEEFINDPPIPSEDYWWFSISGKKGKKIAAILRSKNEVMQVAPLRFPYFDNHITSNEFIYPKGRDLTFDTDYALGLRELIIVCADEILLSSRHPKIDTLGLTHVDLNQFAQLMITQQPNFEVSSYRFSLT